MMAHTSNRFIRNTYTLYVVPSHFCRISHYYYMGSIHDGTLCIQQDVKPKHSIGDDLFLV
jgi:hypothetical protein